MQLNVTVTYSNVEIYVKDILVTNLLTVCLILCVNSKRHRIIASDARLVQSLPLAHVMLRSDDGCYCGLSLWMDRSRLEIETPLIDLIGRCFQMNLESEGND